MNRLTPAAVLLGFIVTVCLVYGPSRAQTGSQMPQSPTQKIDRPRLEIVEDLSESLANDLLELSVATRDRNARLTATFISSTLVSASFPSRRE